MHPFPTLEPPDPARQILRWLREGQDLLNRVVPELLSQYEALRTEARAAKTECENLRLQVADLRAENERLRVQAAAAEQESEALRQELAVIKAAGERTRREQAEIVEALGRFMGETNRLVGEMLQRFRAPGGDAGEASRGVPSWTARPDR